MSSVSRLQHGALWKHNWDSSQPQYKPLSIKGEECGTVVNLSSSDWPNQNDSTGRSQKIQEQTLEHYRPHLLRLRLIRGSCWEKKRDWKKNDIRGRVTSLQSKIKTIRPLSCFSTHTVSPWAHHYDAKLKTGTSASHLIVSSLNYPYGKNIFYGRREHNSVLCKCAPGFFSFLILLLISLAKEFRARFTSETVPGMFILSGNWSLLTWREFVHQITYANK